MRPVLTPRRAGTADDVAQSAVASCEAWSAAHCRRRDGHGEPETRRSAANTRGFRGREPCRRRLGMRALPVSSSTDADHDSVLDSGAAFDGAHR